MLILSIMRSEKFIRLAVIVAMLSAVYLLGPQPVTPEYNLELPVVGDNPEELESYIARKESMHRVRPGNEAEIVWLDSTRNKTEYVVLYLHGFSASKMEGHPTHRKFAKNFGCNLFLPRLSDHGIDTTEMLRLFTADRFWNSAREALSIARNLGEKVIIMSTSSGSTLALKLAAEYPENIFALINLSPNIAINNGAAFLLNNPWGLYIARAVSGGKYRITDAPSEHDKYWNGKYRLEALVELQELLETTMTKETFSNVKQPSLTLYYYKNEDEQDPQVRVDAMLRMHDQLGTPENEKEAIAIPEAGAHVIGSDLTSQDVEGVYNAISTFAQEKLHLREF